ncbi:hypothetical protein EZ313_01590 [Ramlibacter henchirensis]|uniref:Lectin n=1 Tax=Ramlibacter henchirensis TaxID=204072 RepID=A0A4Z0C370_9BURK|nr:hypothetical protein EZ313_01590 [Ramlibacter henchirensis]
MRKASTLTALGSLALLAACTTPSSSGPSASAGSGTGPMSFFITSVGTGRGGDLGGLAGADAHCQKLAAAAGAGSRTWRAYLSTPPTMPSGTTPGVATVNARDRIGKGPWHNAKGVLIARDVNHLHSGANLTKETALDERGGPVPGRTEKPNEHDILTGSRDDGTAFAPQTDTTCKAWTHSGADGSAIVGHHDRAGPTQDVWARSWNFSHQSAGCSQEALVRTGGAGRFYCFAAN